MDWYVNKIFQECVLNKNVYENEGVVDDHVIHGVTVRSEFRFNSRNGFCRDFSEIATIWNGGFEMTISRAPMIGFFSNFQGS